VGLGDVGKGRPRASQSVRRHRITVSPDARRRRSFSGKRGNRQGILGQRTHRLDSAPPAIEVSGRMSLAELGEGGQGISIAGLR
jgi:hypothetical protein